MSQPIPGIFDAPEPVPDCPPSTSMMALERQARAEAERREAELIKDAAPAIEGKYGEIRASKKDFHPGEPIFILRATDPLAPSLIEEYAARAEGAGCAPEFITQAMDHAQRMRKWQRLNADLVKGRPD